MWQTEIVRKCLTPQILILLPSQLLNIFFNVLNKFTIPNPVTAIFQGGVIRPELRLQWHRLM